jgi:hypothetical protein
MVKCKASAALSVRDAGTLYLELYAPSSTSLHAHAACLIRWAVSNGRPDYVHVGTGINGVAMLQALRDDFDAISERRSVLPLPPPPPLQKAADADVERMARGHMRVWRVPHPTIDCKDALGALALMMNVESARNGPAADTMSSAAAAQKRHRAGDHRFRPPPGSDIITIDSDTDCSLGTPPRS